jgi:hypothetical protein
VTLPSVEDVWAPATPPANLLVDFYDRLPRVIEACVGTDVEPHREPAPFSPGFALPELSPEVHRFLAPATARWQELGAYAGRRLVLLDLTGNPGTHTAKTYPALLMVARAVEFIRRTGEPVMLFAPTWANNGTALRDAVLRALHAGLATPEQLRVAVLAPLAALAKLRASRLSTDPDLRALNPLLVHTGSGTESMEPLGREVVERYADRVRQETGAHLWLTAEPANHLVADAPRAFLEARVDPVEVASRPRVHAYAASSGYGLLGYQLGRKVLGAAGTASLVVGHLGAPDLVLHLRYGSFDRGPVPHYAYRAESGLYEQDTDPRFPARTDDPTEVLDRTFATHAPATATALGEVTATYGGEGIVVSLRECVERYPVLRERFSAGPRPLPTDLRTLREWSVVMAATGVLNAIDRGLVGPEYDVVVHGAGWYGTADYEPPRPDALIEVRTAADIVAAICVTR